jgi:hypothetical protein
MSGLTDEYLATMPPHVNCGGRLSLTKDETGKATGTYSCNNCNESGWFIKPADNGETLIIKDISQIETDPLLAATFFLYAQAKVFVRFFEEHLRTHAFKVVPELADSAKVFLAEKGKFDKEPEDVQRQRLEDIDNPEKLHRKISKPN